MEAEINSKQSSGLADDDRLEITRREEPDSVAAISHAAVPPPFAAVQDGGALRQARESADHPLRVTIVQPALPKYRIPVFRELALRPGLDVRVLYGARPDVPNASPEGFAATPVGRRDVKIAGQLVTFQGAEWSASSRSRSDVVVLRWSPQSVALLPALLRARASGVATVLWGHGYSKDERGWRRAARNWLARQASALVFYDPSTRDAFLRDGWNAERMFVALNSLDNTDIDQARMWWIDRPHELAQFRLANGLGSGPVLLFVSRLAPANRVDLLIRATADLAREFPGVKTVIIGNGAAEKARLQSLAAQVGVAGSVVFHDGVYDEMRLAPWFLSADAFCYPANVGLSLIHALWYGLPVVTTDNRAVQNPEVVAFEPGVNGLQYEHESAASMAAALRRIVSDSDLRRSMSEAARQTVVGRFTIKNMVDGLEAAIRYASGNPSLRN